MTSDPRTTPAVLDRIAAERPDAPAVLGADRRLGYAALRSEVRRAAAAMIAAGVAAGDRVAIWSPNTWHWVVACLATHYAGAVLVPLNTRYTAAEATDILARTEAPLLIAMGRFLGADRVGALDRAALPALRTLVRVPVEADDGTWAEFVDTGASVDEAAVDARAAQVGADDVADILFTSGTTGRSKGVLCAHRQSLAGAAAWASCGRMRATDRYLAINPFFHNFGYKAGILACLQTGAALIPQPTFDPVAAMRTVAEQRVTVLPGPPTIYQMLLDHPRRGEFDLTSLRFAVTGAATVPVVLIERMQSELDIDIVLTAYGLTEAAGFGTMCRPDDDAVTVATTCGRPIADFELRLAAQTGEVLLRGPNVMLGYLDDPEATAAAIDADGWLHTGDVGTLDAAGNLAITDRLKDMYICGGFNVYPAETEQVLARLPGVADVAVIGVPDARLGEVGKAFVVAAPGAELDEAAVIGYARQHLANFKTPRSVVFVSTLPRNPGGKVVKPQLREMT
ncbi:fatty acid--CoA ligase family protein [Mycolicibacillus parakoreensis]|uniref:3-((3aS,4S,7aS)-7a-methyl-1, 5-dioxo-octahydro-1H-inden-4-yl)propanoate--CoA ligase FadD3 n=1 Tax=Mycolicibacillus parakoreensis TaxID=1069221 RepID=A0ABY3U5C7_9MYCO|nr:3-((3aS,4S,7aS)-7a-methyl-1,5-dioxo-octahydro-1H-inden-4-yl)propanoate--CoA ligase FadD3 [Mycolicibacillus parakoreensis]MCV7314494.1 fatty acid--CoA ligase family protein [Mycolicibacillus parakoreensis]ULN53170.1 3-((3aS,4S,7aS)-7a-methyl-1,5-dioxo-octahydro-1H-inden-4-yl)propanoate--CoA ligase FadD3 [Mycolicibacillus parakoreensis]